MRGTCLSECFAELITRDDSRCDRNYNEYCDHSELCLSFSSCSRTYRKCCSKVGSFQPFCFLICSNVFFSYIAPKDDRTEYWIINTLRTCLVLTTIFVALIFPYFGTVMGAVGGLTDALQCFVLPPMIYLQVEGDKVSSYFQTYYFVIIFWGIATIIYTAYNAFFELF